MAKLRPCKLREVRPLCGIFSRILDTNGGSKENEGRPVPAIRPTVTSTNPNMSEKYSLGAEPIISMIVTDSHDLIPIVGAEWQRSKVSEVQEDVKQCTISMEEVLVWSDAPKFKPVREIEP